MARPVPFLIGSLGVHFFALAFLCGQVGDEANQTDVFQVTAVPQPRLPDPVVEPEPTEAPTPSPVVEPPLLPREPQRIRRRRQRRSTPSLPTPQPTQLSETTSRAEQPPVLVPPERATPESPEESIVQSAFHRGNINRAAEAVPGRLSGPPRRGRGGGLHGGHGHDRDVCRSVAALFSRQLKTVAPFPQWARNMGLEGDLRLSLRIGRDGRARGIRVLESTGNRGLDSYVMGAARRLGGLPHDCSRPIVVPISYRASRRQH